MKFLRLLPLIALFILPSFLIVGHAVLSPQIPVAQEPEPVPVVMDTSLLAQQGFMELVRPGPWQDVTELIEYQDRLWFANSVTGINHNSADIYSYAPAGGELRYERHLFSQDAGHPAIAEGLLYWPFEDPRFSADLGEYMVTNGEEWQWRVLPEGEAFHVHAMAAHDGVIFAGTGAWSGQLQRLSLGEASPTQNNGQTWEVVYTHPTPEKQVSRITELSFLADELYAGITALHSEEVKLLHWQNDTLTAVPGWPQGRRVKGLAPYKGWLYGINEDADKRVALWRTNGEESERVAGLAGRNIRAIAAGKKESGEEELWAISSDRDGRFLLHSEDGEQWSAVHRFGTMQPLDVAVYRGQVYVGGRDAGHQGVLWGPLLPETTSPTADAASQQIATMPPLPPSPDAKKIEQAIQQLKSKLGDSATFNQGDTQEVLAQSLIPLALSQTTTAGSVLTQQLNRSLPAKQATLFENKMSQPATDVVQWYLLWAMGLNGEGSVPIDLLKETWNTPRNKPEKYWQPVPAAAWTAAQVGQADEGTISALMQRLNKAEDPLWITGDVIGALSVLTGENFGYDLAGWREWWDTKRSQVTVP